MKATMPKRPEPDGYLTIRMIGREVEVNAYRDSTMDAYAEAYANAMVREALEQAIDEVAFHGGSVEIEAAIRALLPSTPAQLADKQ